MSPPLRIEQTGHFFERWRFPIRSGFHGVKLALWIYDHKERFVRDGKRVIIAYYGSSGLTVNAMSESARAWLRDVLSGTCHTAATIGCCLLQFAPLCAFIGVVACPMVRSIRRIVAGNDDSGKAVVLSDGPASDIRVDPARRGCG